MLLRNASRAWAFVLIALYLSSSGHTLRMPESDPNIAVPPENLNDRSKEQRVQVVIRNRINLGAPLVVRWPSRSPSDEFVVEDGAVVETSLAIGETASFSADVEALLDIASSGNRDSFSAIDPYGDGGYDGYADYGDDPYSESYTTVTLTATYKQRGPDPMTLTVAVLDQPPKPLALALNLLPTRKVQEADSMLRLALDPHPSSVTNDGVTASRSSSTSRNRYLKGKGFFTAPLDGHLLEPLAQLAKAAESGHSDARALLALVPRTGWAQDARENAREKATRARARANAAVHAAKAAQQEKGTERDRKVEETSKDTETSRSNSATDAEAPAAAARATALEAIATEAEKQAASLDRFLAWSPARAKRSLEHAAGQGSPLALLTLGQWHRFGIFAPSASNSGSSGSDATPSTTRDHGSINGYGSNNGRSTFGLGSAAPWSNCRVAAEYFLAVADQPRMAMSASMLQDPGKPGSQGGGGGTSLGGAGSPGSGLSGETPVGFYDDAAYSEQARLSHRWLKELSRGSSTSQSVSMAAYGMVGAEGGGPTSLDGDEDFYGGGDSAAAGGWALSPEEMAFHIAEANRLLPLHDQGQGRAVAGGAIGQGGGGNGGGGIFGGGGTWGNNGGGVGGRGAIGNHGRGAPLNGGGGGGDGLLSSWFNNGWNLWQALMGEEAAQDSKNAGRSGANKQRSSNKRRSSRDADKSESSGIDGLENDNSDDDTNDDEDDEEDEMVRRARVASASDADYDAADSAYTVAQAYETGTSGLPVDLVKARKYFAAAASTGLLPEADEALGIFAANGFGYPSTPSSSSDGGSSSSSSDSGAASGNDSGDDVDMHTTPGIPDYAAARRHLKRAATPQAWTLLGDLYQWGQLDDVIRKDLKLPPLSPETKSSSKSSSSSGTSRGAAYGRNGRDQQQQQQQRRGAASKKKGSSSPGEEEEAQEVLVAERANLEAWHMYSFAAASEHAPALTAMGTMVLFGTAPQSRSRGGSSSDDATSASSHSSHSSSSSSSSYASYESYGNALPGAAEGAAAEAVAIAATAAQAAQVKAEVTNSPSSLGDHEKGYDEGEWTEEVAQAWVERGLEDGALARDYAEAWALFGAALRVLEEEDAQRNKPAHLFYDPVKLDAVYYRGLMSLHGWGPGGEYNSSSSSSRSSASHRSSEGGRDESWSEEGEDSRPDWALCEASTLLEEAARHTLWLAADLNSAQSLPSTGTKTPSGRSSSSSSSDSNSHILGQEFPLVHLTSLYGLLQSALISYEQQDELSGSDLLDTLAPASPSPSSSSSSSQQPHHWQQQQPLPSREDKKLLHEKGEDEELALNLILPEALRRYELLALLGEPQAMLNTAWLYTQHAKHVEKVAAAASEGSWSNRLRSWNSVATAAATTAATAVLPHALSEALFELIGELVPSHGRTTADTRREEGNSGDESCPADEFRSSSGSSSNDDKSSNGHSAEAALQHLVKEKQAQWLSRARQWYASAATLGVVEAQRELGTCLAGLDDNTWQGACTKDAATVGAAREDAAASVGLARKQIKDADAAAAAAAEVEEGASDTSRKASYRSVTMPDPAAAAGKTRAHSGEEGAGGSALEDAHLLLETAGTVGGDLQALRSLAYWHSGYASTTPGKVRGEGNTDSSGSTGSGDSGSSSTASRGDRSFSRSLYTQCAALGGYPDGLPCQVEAAAMELYWLASDVKAFLGWR